MQLSYSPTRSIAEEAYAFFYPLVIMEKTRQTHMAVGSEMGRLFHQRKRSTHKERTVARPNADTLFSSVWLDLNNGPVILKTPESLGRYYMYQVLDAWSDTICVVGSRTVGEGPTSVAFVPTGWTGHLPEGVFAVTAPTRTLWIIGRVYVAGDDDLSAALAFQNAVELIQSQGSNEATTKELFPPVTMPPVAQVGALSAEEFFNLGAALMARETPHGTDGSQLLRLARLGFLPGKVFKFSEQSEEVQEALGSAPLSVLPRLKRPRNDPFAMVNGWHINRSQIGVWANSYFLRALVALVGLAANPVEDALYPGLLKDSEGNRIDGAVNYKLHFEPGNTPPADAFWSITAYDADGFLIENELNRYCIGSSDQIEYNEDGSLDIYLGPTLPSESPLSNWLPTCEGGSNPSLRLYDPRPEAYDGTWKPPVAQRI
jgi:hypothetical protein